MQTQSPKQEYRLVELKTKKEFEEEGQRMQHALHCFFSFFEKNKVRVFSLRAGAEPLLTLSVQSEGFTDHIVGLRNRPPTQEDFDILNPLLAELGIENRYDPDTIY